jgi:hypothetical protein
MCDAISPFNKFVFESAGKYLQTVVVVDDRIYENSSGSVAARLTAPPTKLRKVALKSAERAGIKKDATDKKTENKEEPDEVSFHDVQNSFAKKRIICSLYQPKKTALFSEHSDVYSLCSAADVVIVDWDLHGDSGDKATELAGILIEESMKEIPNQLRLVLIYTMEVNLRSIADKLYEALVQRIGQQNINVDSQAKGLVLTTDNARIVVLGKRENTTLTEYADFWAPEKKLAERTIYEFSQLASGLLQSIVLCGVANLRENNRRILMRFHKGLDTAFLTHRALLLPDEAFGQIVPLLTDELRAVLEDTLGEFPMGKGSAVERLITDWCTKHWKPGTNAKAFVGESGNALGLATTAFCKGQSVQEEYKKFQKGKNCKSLGWGKPDKRLEMAEFLLGNLEADSCHQKLGSLMSQRIQYEDTRRALHLGVIVKEMNEQEQYVLCLQPVCDSIRISGKTRGFIFCRLDECKDGKGLTHVVMDIKGNVIQLKYNPKVFNCFVSGFTTGSDAVCATKDGEGRYIFEDVGKNKYEWIAELKTEHSQRAAEEFGRTLSRVGLTESEWLRLKAK